LALSSIGHYFYQQLFRAQNSEVNALLRRREGGQARLLKDWKAADEAGVELAGKGIDTENVWKRTIAITRMKLLFDKLSAAYFL